MITILFPCGLPSILHDYNYSDEKRDRVEATCIELQKHNICSEEMVADCLEHHLNELVEAQIKARKYFNQFNRRSY